MNFKKPELLVTAKNIDELKQLADSGADAINIGEEEYGLRAPGNFTLDMIEEAVAIAHAKQVKIYILVNALIHNESLPGLPDYLKKLQEYNVDAIVFGDPAVLMTAKEVAPNIPLHLNTETTSTNATTINYWAAKGAIRAVLARELSFDEVTDIKKNVNIEVQALVHGMTCIFHSKRSLVKGYLEFNDSKYAIGNANQSKGLYLQEHKRPGQQYPIFEDRHGTHIMSEYDTCMLEHVDKFISAGIDSLKIDGILQPTNYLVKVTKLYRQAIDRAIANRPLTDLMEEIKKIQPENRPLGTGFYFRELFY